VNLLKKKEILGPGSYDIDFAEELKILDHKLSSRYQGNQDLFIIIVSPFGSSAPRFNLLKEQFKAHEAA
jgi:hypothetical protein